MSNIKVITQYIKDFSFEVPNAPEIFMSNLEKPDIGLSIDLDAKKISNKHLYEVTLKIKANAENDKPVFICEIAYSGIFSFENVAEEILEQLLLVYCPNLLFPFVRRIIANTTADSGLPPLMIDPIDFQALYVKRQKS